MINQDLVYGRTIGLVLLGNGFYSIKDVFMFGVSLAVSFPVIAYKACITGAKKLMIVFTNYYITLCYQLAYLKYFVILIEE